MKEYYRKCLTRLLTDGIKSTPGLVLMVLCVLLLSCVPDGAPVYKQALNGAYYLDALDDDKDMAISIEDSAGNGVGVVKATVFAVGQNDAFIIAKQHPLREGGSIDKATVNYYIIPLTMKVSTQIDRNYFGPLTADEFKAKSNELALRNIRFTIYFNELDS
jgi:hypothetical protein